LNILYTILDENEQLQLKDTIFDLCDLILIIPDSNDTIDDDYSYKFVHERVQRAAYSLIPTSLRSSLHLQIGLAHYHVSISVIIYFYYTLIVLLF
jgi:predicted ATPase